MTFGSFRLWSVRGLTLALLVLPLALAQRAADAEDVPAAAELPQPCIEAGVTAQDACDALLADQDAAAQKAATKKAAKEKAAADQAAAEKAAAEQAAAEQAATEKAAADQAAADKAAADNASSEKAAAMKAAADQAAADQAAADKAAADQAAADEAAAEQAAAAKAETDAAATKKSAAKKAAADKAAADQAAADQAAADQAAADKAAADLAEADANAAKTAAAQKAAADKAAADQAETPAEPPAQPAVTAAKPVKKRQPTGLSQECIDAGLTDAEQCDAMRAIAGQKAKTPDPAPAIDAVVAPEPAAPAVELPAAAPVEPAVVAAPALPDIGPGLAAAAKSYNRSVAVLGKAGADAATAEKARAKLKSVQAEIDTLCKSNNFTSADQCLAQYAIQLSPLPAADGGQVAAVAPVQPVEVIKALPKGVTQEDVAPLLDSAKDQVAVADAVKAGAAQPAPVAQTAAPVAVSTAPPPKSDKAAQTGLKVAAVAPIDAQKGQQIAADAVGQVQVPQNVTIVNQTVINNTTNTTTNNVTTNNTTNIQKNDGAGVLVSGVTGDPGKRNRKPIGGGAKQASNPIGLSFGIVVQLGNQLIINSPARDERRIAYASQDRTTFERLPGQRFRETITRPDGVRIVTIYNRNGDILRRSRFDSRGLEIVLAYFDEQHDEDLLQWRDPGEELPPLRLRIPAREYVLDSDRAEEVQVQRFFAQPPVERVRRLYSINEVKRSSRIRDMVRRLEIGNLSFDTGAATISQDQVRNLSKVAGAMLQLLKKNPAETFLIEGHTDAVGPDISNLRLSDARATTIAEILTDYYRVPPENLATQGYGERYLKINTDFAERLNRRVTVRRITSLVTVARN